MGSENVDNESLSETSQPDDTNKPEPTNHDSSVASKPKTEGQPPPKEEEALEGRKASAIDSVLVGGKDKENSPDSSEKRRTEKSFAPPPSERWQQFDSLERAQFPPDSNAVRAWSQDSSAARAIVVCGDDAEVTQGTAEQLAFEINQWEEVRKTSYHSEAYARYDSDQNIEVLLQANTKRCLVVGYWNNYGISQIVFDLDELSKAIKQQADKNFCLILWTRTRSLEDLRHPWPSNVKRCQLETPKRAPEPKATQSVDLFGKLFGHEVSSLHEVLAAGQQLIERTLARICVLFGELPETEIEVLLSSILKDETVTIPAQNKDDSAVTESALNLWKNGKALFLKNAGLQRIESTSGLRIGFATESVGEAAAQAAWSDSHSMMEIFSSIRESAILFSDESTAGRKDLFEGYINAVVLLAKKLPQLYGATWLDSISLEYLDWVRNETSDSASFGDSSGLAELLNALETMKNQHRRRALEDRFIRRMGYLCRYLTIHSLPMVEKFLTNLQQKRLHSIAWDLILELRNSELDSPEWIKKSLHNFPSDQLPDALEVMAFESLTGSSKMVEHSSMFAQWLPKDDKPPKNQLEHAALFFPPLCIKAWFIRCQYKRPPSFDLKKALELDSGTSESTNLRISDFWLSSLSSAHVSQILTKHFSTSLEKTDESQWAITVFKMLAVATTTDSMQSGVDLARKLRSSNPRRWNLLREFWRELMTNFQVEAKRASDRDESLIHQRYYECCRRLIQL